MNINDIYFCHDGKCPICTSKMQGDVTSYYECPNGCYVMDRSDDFEDNILIFGCHFSVALGMGPYEEDVKKVITSINYWKKNDRYLVEILSK